MTSDAKIKVGDRFELLEPLGAGAMGQVFRAHDKVRRMDVALKTLRRVDGARLRQFKSEFRSLAGIVHPNLVTLYELQAEQGEWFFTMELVDGVSFVEYIRAGADARGPALARAVHAADATATLGGEPEMPPLTHFGGPVSSYSTVERRLANTELDLDRLRACLPQLAQGIHALHRAGRLHCDIKPSNVLVDNDGRVVICDFGLVASLEQAQRGSGRVAGTPVYMSPEQARGEPLGPASDWYAVGSMLHLALSGLAPVTGTPAEIIEQKQNRNLVAPPALELSLDSALEATCIALLAPASANRLSGVSAVRRLGGEARVGTELAGPTLSDASQVVGREHQLAQLRQALADSRNGHSVAVFVHGRSGMGKSSLVHRFLAQERARGNAVLLEGRCYQRETVPYKVLDTIVDALSGFLSSGWLAESDDLLPADIHCLTRLFPVLDRVDAIRNVTAAPVPKDPRAVRVRAFGALRELLSRLATRWPTVVYIDDLQWGDQDSMGVLIDLIHHPAPPSVMLIGTYRSEEARTNPALRALLEAGATTGIAGDVRSMELLPLVGQQARELAESLLAGDASPGVVDEILQEAAGHPLFIAELARSARLGKASRQQGGGLDDILRGRISAIGEMPRAMLTACSLAARPIAVGVVARASGVDDEAGALAVLLAEQMVRLRRIGELDVVEPYHDRMRESATSLLDAAETRRLHRKLARSCESSNQVDPLALVEHWLGAGDRARAGEYALLSAEQADEALAFARAAEHYELAMELLELDHLQRTAATVKMADALAADGNLVRAADAYCAAADMSEKTEALDLRRRGMEQLLRAGKLERGMELAHEVTAAVGLKIPRSRAAAMATIVINRLRAKRRGLHFHPRPESEITAQDRQRLDVHWSVGSGLSLVDPLRGTAFQARNLLSALATGDPRRAVLALSLEIGFRSFAGGKVKAELEKLIADCGALIDDSTAPAAVGVYHTAIGLANFALGEFERSRQGFVEGERVMSDQGHRIRWQLDICFVYRMSALWFLGKFEDLVIQVPTLLRDAVERGDEYMARLLRASRSNATWLVMDQPEDARRQLALGSTPRARREFQLAHYYQLLSACQIDLYERQGRDAWSRIGEQWPALKGSMLFSHSQSVRIDAYFLRGRCALAQALEGGDAGRAKLLRTVETMARKLEREHMAWADGFAALLRGCCARLQEDEERAAAELGAAADVFAKADLRYFEALARRRLRAIAGQDDGAKDDEVASRRDAELWRQVKRPESLAWMCAPWTE